MLLLRGGLPPAALAGIAEAHVVEACPRCAAERSALGAPAGGDERAAVAAANPVGVEPVDDDRHRWSQRLVEQRRARLSRSREMRRRETRDLDRLLAVPAAERPARIRRSRSRFRSRMLAELLLLECKGIVRNQPREAQELAGLVPLVVHRIPGDPELPWRRDLELRAHAHVANALRVSGELARADRIFARLRSELEERPVTEPRIDAELTSLEASLRIDQRAYAAAGRLLDREIDLQRSLGDNLGVARALIKLGNLLGTEGKPLAAIDAHRKAAAAIDPYDTFLMLCTVTGRFVSLCDLDRFAEAERLLDEHTADYLGGDRFSFVSYHALRGRVRLGLGRANEAVADFEVGREGLAALGRHFDAAIVGLDQAVALFETRRLGELEALAADLVPVFQAIGADREILATLALLARAGERRVSETVLERLREHLRTARAGLAAAGSLDAGV